MAVADVRGVDQHSIVIGCLTRSLAPNIRTPDYYTSHSVVNDCHPYNRRVAEEFTRPSPAAAKKLLGMYIRDWLGELMDDERHGEHPLRWPRTF
jgi:hypothetical protein